MNASHSPRTLAIALLACPLALALRGHGAAAPGPDPIDPVTVEFLNAQIFGTEPLSPLTLQAVSANGELFIREYPVGCGAGCSVPSLTVERNGSYAFGIEGKYYYPNDDEFDPLLGGDPVDGFTRQIGIEHTNYVPLDIDDPNVTTTEASGFGYGAGATGIVTGQVLVDGGRITRLEIWAEAEVDSELEIYADGDSEPADGDEFEEHYRAYYEEMNVFSDESELDRRAKLASAGSDADFVEGFGFLMVSRADIRVIGLAHVETDLGFALPPILLDEQPIAVTGGMTTNVSWPRIELDSLEPSEFGGIVAAPFFSDSVEAVTPLRRAQYHLVRADGIANTPTDGLAVSDLVFAEFGKYVLANLFPGGYYIAAETNFVNPPAFLRRPSIPQTILAGNTVEDADIDDPFGYIQAPVVMSGFYTLSNTQQVRYVRVLAEGFDEDTGAVGRANVAGGVANIPVTVGPQWQPDHYTAFIRDDAAAVNVTLDGWEARDPVALADNGSGLVLVPQFEIVTTRTAVVLDILGSAQLRDARVWGTTTTGDLQTFQAYVPTGLAGQAEQPRVEIVAEPGEYTIHASAVITGLNTLVEWPASRLTVLPPAEPDASGLVDIEGQVRVVFNEPVAGYVSVAASEIGPLLPTTDRYYRLDSDQPTVYYEIFTTIVPEQPFLVCLYYDPAVVDESQLRLMHYDPSDDESCPGTPAGLDHGNGWCETVAIPEPAYNRICGVASSFSPFVLTVPVDEDGDGIEVQDDNCPSVDNVDQLDGDGDGIGDACDSCNAGDDAAGADADGDGVIDLDDNCPQHANGDQADVDGDDTGDACDDCASGIDAACTDADGDGIVNASDNCPLHANADQSDVDGDGIGDACDSCIAGFDPVCTDSDGDGIYDADDDCPLHANADQSDVDGDGIGDACDACNAGFDDGCTDDDGDGTANADDNCPLAANADQADADADGQGDVCDPCPLDPLDDDDGDGLCADVDACEDTAIPEVTVPSIQLRKNRFALIDGDTQFDTPQPAQGGALGLSFTLEDTAGCSCEQIIAALGLGLGVVKYGCTVEAMQTWIAGL